MWRVVTGATQLTQLGPEVQVRQIKQLRIHEHYIPGEERNDIALLKLDQPVVCSRYVQLGCVPEATLNVLELKTCYIAGWVSTTTAGEFPKRTHGLRANLAHQGEWVGLPNSRGQSQSQAARGVPLERQSWTTSQSQTEGGKQGNRVFP